MSGPEPQNRVLSLSEHAALLWVLRALPDSSVAELLYRQSMATVIQGGPLTMRELAVPPSCAAAPIPDGALPVRAVAYDDEGTPLGELLVWLTDGYLSAIEYAWYTDTAPTELPGPCQFRQE